MTIKRCDILVSAVIAVGALSTAAVADLTAQITVDPAAVVSTDRLVVTITGRYTLGPAGPNSQTSGVLTVSQASGTEVAGGHVFFTPIADGVEHTFVFNVHAENRPFHGGKGRVQASVRVDDCSTCCPCASASGSADVQVSIRGGGN
ncbi:MAG TPA: hypothetical protein VGK93_06035 [Candidatus Eisenbacteria bacterium]|jgi:hypothetical protein